MNVYRAPTDNDGGFTRRWNRAGLNDLSYTVQDVTVRQLNNKAVQVTTRMTCTGAQETGFDHTCTYTVFGNGYIDVDNYVEPFGELPDLPKIGVTMRVNEDFDVMHWFGKGPHDPKGKRYVLPEMLKQERGDRTIAGDVTQTTIDSLGLKVDQPFGYWFDYGDDWWHQIDVLATEDKAPKGKYPRVTKRVGKSPPQYMDEEE